MGRSFHSSPPRRFRLGAALPGDSSSLLRELLGAGGWRETADADADLAWTHAVPRPAEFRRSPSDPGRSLNHLAGEDELIKKYRLREHAAAAARLAERAGAADPPGFVPETFLMSEELDALRLAAAYGPASRWIRRPKTTQAQHAALLAALEGVGADRRWLVQRYVPAPDLLDGVKYTLRLYVLITGLDPICVYVHDRVGILRAAAPWTEAPACLDMAVHATTVAERDGGARWRGHADGLPGGAARVLERCGFMLATTIAAARDAMLAAADALQTAPGGFALLEADVLVDRDARPWLLDIGTWPSTRGSPADAAVLRDALSLVGALEARDAGGFRPLLPSADGGLLAVLPALRPADVDMIRQRAAATAAPPIRLRPAAVQHVPLDESLVLYGERERQLYVLNPTAAFMWLRCAEGAAPGEIGNELAALFPDFAARAEHDAWATALEWLRLGLLAPGRSPAYAPEAISPRHRYRRLQWNADARVYQVDSVRVSVRYPGPDVASWVHPTLERLEVHDADEYDSALEIRARRRGYAIEIDGDMAADAVPPSTLAASVHRHLLEQAHRLSGGLLTLRTSLLSQGADSLLVLGDALTGSRFRTASTQAGLQLETHVKVTIRRDPVRIVRAGAPDRELRLRALVIGETAVRAPTALAVEPRAEALRRLLVEDEGMTSTLDAAGAVSLVAFIARLECCRLAAASPGEGVAHLARLLAAADREGGSLSDSRQ